jgi:lysophospholipase L1-like esterase
MERQQMTKPKRILLACLALALFCAGASRADAQSAQAGSPAATPAARTAGHDFAQWEKAVAAFEAADRTSPPPKDAVLFVGSSTIVRWKTLQEDFPGARVINRGFGGNEIADSTYYADRMIVPYRPRTIFLRAGGNDIHNGKTPEQVFADFKEFVATVRAKLPDTEIVFISLSPSIARWNERAANKQLNTLVADFVARTPGLKYIETYDTTLDASGQPRPELFVEDKLHFSPEGYKLLVERVRPYIPK